MMEEARRFGAAEHAAQGDLDRRGFAKIIAADHEIDPVPEVVHDHAQGIGPVAVLITQSRVAPGGHGPCLGAEHEVGPCLFPVACGRSERHPGLVDPKTAGSAPTWTARTRPRAVVRCGPGPKHLATAIAGVHAAPPSKIRDDVRIDRTVVGLAIWRWLS